MEQRKPPKLAYWMLEYLTPGNRNGELTGDLLEEFQLGRSQFWFWKQAVTASFLGSFHSLLRRRMALVFAIFWSLLSNSWDVLLMQVDQHVDLAGFIWRMPWPWSTLSDFGWTSFRALVFVWMGALSYITVFAIFGKPAKLRSLVRGIGSSIIAYGIAYSCWTACLTLMLPRSGVDLHKLHWWDAIENIGMFGVATCVPSVLAMMCALWSTESGSSRPVGRAS